MRWRILRQRLPLVAPIEDVYHAVNHVSFADRSLVAPFFAGGVNAHFLARQVARIATFALVRADHGPHSSTSGGSRASHRRQGITTGSSDSRCSLMDTKDKQVSTGIQLAGPGPGTAIVSASCSLALAQSGNLSRTLAQR